MLQLNDQEREILRRATSRIGTAQVYLSHLFDKQLDVVFDESDRKTVRCGRRSGKTRMLSINMLHKALSSYNAIVLYIALSRPTAELLMWTPLQRLDEVYGLGFKFDHQRLIAIAPNGSEIRLLGADDRKEREKLRGHAFTEVCIDEAGSFGHYMDYLVDEVIGPGMQDYAGTIVLAGTPPPTCIGKFYEADVEEKSWSNHHWTVMDNPKFPQWADKKNWKSYAKRWMKELRDKHGWDEQHPVYQREWLGNWVRENNSLMYRFDPERNTYLDLELDGDEMRILGVDLGYTDATAFVVGAFSQKRPGFYVIEEHKETGMIPQDIAEKIKSICSEHNPFAIVMDTGGLGKSIAEEFRRRYSIPVRAAQKKDKYAFVEHMNNDMMLGLVKAKNASELCTEWQMIQRDASGKAEDPRFENHLADACLYAWRESRHYQYKPKPKRPQRGSPEWYEAEEKRMFERDVLYEPVKKRARTLEDMVRR